MTIFVGPYKLKTFDRCVASAKLSRGTFLIPGLRKREEGLDVAMSAILLGSSTLKDLDRHGPPHHSLKQVVSIPL